MRTEIEELRKALASCEKKYSKIISNLIRENVDLKYEN